MLPCWPKTRKRSFKYWRPIRLPFFITALKIFSPDLRHHRENRCEGSTVETPQYQTGFDQCQCPWGAGVSLVSYWFQINRSTSAFNLFRANKASWRLRDISSRSRSNPSLSLNFRSSDTKCRELAEFGKPHFSYQQNQAPPSFIAEGRSPG